ncbi:lysophospholipase [Naematelia encephala]|uniref:Lysophospholipase n=1 Tax=Naematelia encephala TaxID=71784 RepID=A0A1Y2AXE7_9TREE|nr:lysophospholipase [Naematelia encephala]
MPLHNPLWEILEPYLVNLGLYKVTDPTYGRWALPPYPRHSILLDNPAITHTFRRVFLPPYSSFHTKAEAYDSTAITFAEDVTLTPDELATGVARGGRWIFYSTWELKEEPENGWEGGGRGRGRDLLLVHGLSDYGLRYAPHVEYFLRAGFRVILPDLPSYGRSTGINSYIPSLLLLPAAVHAVLSDVVSSDLAKGREQRKVFLSGASMGGWTVLYYCLKYPPTSSALDIVATAEDHDDSPPPGGQGKGYRNAERPRDAEKVRPSIAGAYVMCPMVEAAKNSRPSAVIEYIAKAIVYFAGSLPLAKAVRGNVSDDPRVEEEFFEDPLCYHGYLRVGTGLSLLDGMLELQRRAEEIDIPIRLVHGSADRATSHVGTLKLFDRLPNEDKEVEVFEGYEHVMLKVGRDEQDDQKRQRVLEDWRNWLLKRC